MLAYLWIAAGVARYAFSGLVARQFGETFPWGTLLVNVTGSFAIGFFNTLTSPGGRWLPPVSARQFLMVGIFGGYTTFSSFSLQTLNLLEDGEWFYASANILLSVAACLFTVWLGHLLAMSLNSMKS